MKENICNKEIHAYQNEDGTYRVEISEALQELSKKQLIYLIEQMESSLCKIGEACVEESKGHRTPEEAIEDIRGYIFNMPSLVDAEKAKRAIDLITEKEK